MADVHRREQTAPAGGARDRWRPERVLPRLGLSIDMAGKSVVQNILEQNVKSLQEKPASQENNEDKPALVNGKHEENNLDKSQVPLDVDKLNPVAAIQVTYIFYSFMLYSTNSRVCG